MRGISCDFGLTLKKGKPAIPIGTLLALATPTHTPRGGVQVGAVIEDRPPGPQRSFSPSRAPSLKSDFPSNPVGIYYALVGTVILLAARYIGNE